MKAQSISNHGTLKNNPVHKGHTPGHLPDFWTSVK